MSNAPRNLVLVTVLAVLYVASVLFLYMSAFLFLVPVPITIAGYQLAYGSPLLRRALVSAVPFASLPLLIVFSAGREFISVAVLHTLLIGLLYVQIWEVLLWVVGSNKSLKSDARKSRAS